MLPTVVDVTAPSRLHFGLFSFGGGTRQFGGVGAMVDKPGLQLRATKAESFRASGPHTHRVREFAERWATFHGLASVPACEIGVLDSPPDHVGLGTGTQLGLAVATALNTLHAFPSPTPVELALSVGRAQRSAVGTYGFCGGGMVVERGRAANEPISPLDCQFNLPSDWRFVLVIPRGLTGMSGAEEQQTFSTLPRVPAEVSDRLIAEVRTRLLPAAARGDFTSFSESVYDFGHAAGLCFAPKQGGPYNGPILAELVKTIRDRGVRGVGQSSWGPTIFALLQNQEKAEQFVLDLKHHYKKSLQAELELTMIITPPNKGGARVRIGNAAP